MMLHRMLPISMAAAVITALIVPASFAAVSSPMFTYTASGTLATTPISGQDRLELAGEPFAVSISVSPGAVPAEHGPNWCMYNKLMLKGVVHAGVLGSTPENIVSNVATIVQAVDPGVDDVFTMEAPIKIIDVIFTIKAVIVLPDGTLKNGLLYPFGAVSLSPADATVTVAYNGESTALAVQTGTLTATVSNGSTTTKTAVRLQLNGAESMIQHADATQTVRPLRGGAIDLGLPSDSSRVKFYASGVSDASEVHVAIGGEEVPVLFAGESGYYQGLDEIIVELPRTLARRGATEVLLTADGQTADPIQIHIQ